MRFRHELVFRVNRSAACITCVPWVLDRHACNVEQVRSLDLPRQTKGQTHAGESLEERS